MVDRVKQRISDMIEQARQDYRPFG